MNKKTILTLVVTLKILFCIGQTKEQGNNENWQSALDELNTYTKQKLNQTFEVNKDMLIKHEDGHKLEIIIKDYHNVIKYPEFKSVFVSKKDGHDCVDAYFNYRQGDNVGFYLQCESEEEMDKVFELFSTFWQKLTGIDSKIKYSNSELYKMQYISRRSVYLIGYEKKVKNKKMPSINRNIYAVSLYLNNDMETYDGYIDYGGKEIWVSKIRIENILNDTVTFIENPKRTVVRHNSNKSKNNASMSIQEEVLLEDKKLAKELEEYNKSMLMYVKDCEKDKQMKQILPYGKSTACRNIVMYNKLFVSAINRFLEKYEKYITPESKAHLIKQKKQAENNIIESTY
jgi:hypothetical protein